MTRTITLPTQPLHRSSAFQFLENNRSSCSKPAHESKLLQAIRSALRGSDTDDRSTIHTAFHHDTQSDGRELTWNADTVVLSYGGVIRRTWSFGQEGESIQWACLGMLEQVDAVPRYNLQTSTSSTVSQSQSDNSSSERPTFGPFTRVQAAAASQMASIPSYIPAIFVFLRSIGRIFLQDGTEHSFSLPFIVRKAWSVSPHGVMIQRVLEPSEFVEADLTGEAILPTIFSMTGPLAEAAAVGLTAGIIGGAGGIPARLKDETENSTQPLRSIPSSEMIVTVTGRGKDCSVSFVVTVDVEQRKLSLWRYTYLKPKDLPPPLKENQTRDPSKRQSMAGQASRRASAIYDGAGRLHRPLSPGRLSPEISPTADIFDVPPPDMPPLSALPRMAPSLSTATALQSLVSGGTSQHSSTTTAKGRRVSLSKNDLSTIMDRMAFGGREEVVDLELPIEHGRMKAAYWMERVYVQDIPEEDAKSWRDITFSPFDGRFDGCQERALLAIQLPKSQVALILMASFRDDHTMKVNQASQIPAIASTSLRATREFVWDLLVLKPDHRLALFTHGIREIPIELSGNLEPSTDNSGMDLENPNVIVRLSRVAMCSVALTFANNSKTRLDLPLNPNDPLTEECLAILAQCLTSEASFILHCAFLDRWSQKGLSSVEGVQFDCLTDAVYTVFQLQHEGVPRPSEPWEQLAISTSHQEFKEDPVLRKLRRPPDIPPLKPAQMPKRPSKLLSPMLYALHTLAEYLRVIVNRYQDLLRLVPVICRLALEVRPEWADYWQRLVPDPVGVWPVATACPTTQLDDRIPVWPPDISAIFYGRLSNSEWKVPWHDASQIAARFGVQPPSFEYGRRDPLHFLRDLSTLYLLLTDGQTPDIRMRAERAILFLVTKGGDKYIHSLPLGIAAPIREAARTCQLAPPPAWPLQAYMTIGRNDLAASATQQGEQSFKKDGLKSRKDFLSPGQSRQTISHFVSAARAAGGGEVDVVTGVELDLEGFTSIRFGQDRRLEEVTRMLRSSAVTSIKIPDRPDLSEHDQTKEHQNHVMRIAERTLALPYGRAMFTFGSVPTVTREAYTIPKLEFTIRVQPLNITVTPEAGKISPESLNWGEFHNGVAAGLRISPTASGVESSWIAFNKPSELSPEHAGFLLGLGLTGHLKHMMTWHTFSYLTPKHDLTSIGVLLGLSAANIGSADQHVTKLLAVHTPALLPTPSVDLNVSFMTQAAGLAGVGLLYLGTKNRRMAEVCLNQISRRDLVQPDLNNEHREAYTYAAALAFGMIMLGKGTTIPADATLLSRLNTLIHGDADPMAGKRIRVSFDVNLTSPAATIALGLMYLRTERQDIADLLPIPDTVLALNQIQPSFLTVRTIARNLIMWNTIAPSNEWLMSQIPASIREAIEAKSKAHKNVDESFELAYYNILAGCCFLIGLKYAGTARQEAYLLIVRYFDLYTRLAYANGPAFDHRIKRSAVRDGLNLISISLSMVMAGTGEISCLRRVRYAYGICQQSGYHHGLKYGVHISTHMALGLLFLGAGRFTLGTSDAAIACLVTAFFPRSHSMSSDNKSFLQALRHLWALAVEPRCLIARDVDTGAVVYLPVKIVFREEKETSVTLISPTLIPDIDKLVSIRVDTPRYWPFYLDTDQVPRHKEALSQSQTLYVKRRTAFLSYAEDPKGSRSLFVRSGSSTGDAATLDFPQLTDTKSHPASDLSEFITSFSNDVLFLAFADHLARGDDDMTDKERLFHKYCHAALLDSILQDKLQTLQSHLTLYQYKTMEPRSQYFNLRLQDLRFAADFYSKIFDRRFSGRADNNPRPPLIRDTGVLGALYALDRRLERVRTSETFLRALGEYARGSVITQIALSNVHMGQMGPDGEDDSRLDIVRQLAWYLLRNGVPVSTLLVVLKQLAQDAHKQCLGVSPPDGTNDGAILDLGIKEVLHGTGTKMTTALGSGWSAKSLDEIVHVWGLDSINATSTIDS